MYLYIYVCCIKNNSILITATAPFYCQIIQGLHIGNDYKADQLSQLSSVEENCKNKVFFKWTRTPSVHDSSLIFFVILETSALIYCVCY